MPKRPESPDVPDPFLFHVRVKTAKGSSLILPAEYVQEDRVANSNGCHELDQVKILLAGDHHWVERRDLCEDDGEPIQWVPYSEPHDD